MAEVDVQVRKWGDSLAVIIPRSIAAEENLAPNDRVHLQVSKEVSLRDVFGIAKGKLKQSLQELKDEARKGWD